MDAESLLASWADTPTRAAIVDFVTAVTGRGPCVVRWRLVVPRAPRRRGRGSGSGRGTAGIPARRCMSSRRWRTGPTGAGGQNCANARVWTVRGVMSRSGPGCVRYRGSSCRTAPTNCSRVRSPRPASCGSRATRAGGSIQTCSGPTTARGTSRPMSTLVALRRRFGALRGRHRRCGATSAVDVTLDAILAVFG